MPTSYRAGRARSGSPPERVIAFRYPDPRDPYLAGLSPLRACYEQARLLSELAGVQAARSSTTTPCPTRSSAPRRSSARRSATGSRRSGTSGCAAAARAASWSPSRRMRVQLLRALDGRPGGAGRPAGDARRTSANAFGVPLAVPDQPRRTWPTCRRPSSSTPRQAILPRLRRRDEKLNEQLVPLFDPTRPAVPGQRRPGARATASSALRERELAPAVRRRDGQRGARAEGLPPVPWGDQSERPRSCAGGANRQEEVEHAMRTQRSTATPKARSASPCPTRPTPRPSTRSCASRPEPRLSAMVVRKPATDLPRRAPTCSWISTEAIDR